MTEFRFVLSTILQVLPKYGYRLSSERVVQDGIAEVLQQEGIEFEREAIRGGDRFDFLCGSGVVIEVKTAGSYSEALRQAERYCRQDDVSAVVLASSRRWRTQAKPVEFNGRPVHTVMLRSSLF